MKYLIAVFMILISGCIKNPFAPDEKIPSFVGTWEDPFSLGPATNKDSSYVRIGFSSDGQIFWAREIFLDQSFSEYKKGSWGRRNGDTLFIVWTKGWTGFGERARPFPTFQMYDSIYIDVIGDKMELVWLKSGGDEEMFKMDSFPRPVFLPDSVEWL